MKKTIYAGTYTGTGSRGIYRMDFEDGILSSPELFCEIANPKYIAMHEGRITTVCDLNGRSGAALLNEKGEITDEAAYENGTSCYVGRCGDRIYTANYHEGTFSYLKETDGKLKFKDTVLIRERAGCHQVLCLNDRIYVPCLFLDRVVIFDSELKKTGSIRFNRGTGPRHGVFSADGKYLYLISELSNELFVISTETNEILSSISVLPGGETHRRDSAAIRLSEDGKYLYVSTRTMDILSVIRLNGTEPELIQTVPCGGRHPRDFILCGSWLLCANRFSNSIVSFRILEDGTVGEQVSSVAVPEAVSLVCAD
jgi:6-phosphogluconolactonase